MVAYHPPSSTSVVHIADSLVDRYVAAGWTAVEQPKDPAPVSVPDEKPRPVKRTRRKS